ncbi:unnamed protein product [Amoebophrya sp. A25]|nr:unnamed protein product [Amoebophrya sp. A25]|eukprot:GSA25T00021713001.1
MSCGMYHSIYGSRGTPQEKGEALAEAGEILSPFDSASAAVKKLEAALKHRHFQFPPTDAEAQENESPTDLAEAKQRLLSSCDTARMELLAINDAPCRGWMVDLEAKAEVWAKRLIRLHQVVEDDCDALTVREGRFLVVDGVKCPQYIKDGASRVAAAQRMSSQLLQKWGSKGAIDFITSKKAEIGRKVAFEGIEAVAELVDYWDAVLRQVKDDLGKETEKVEPRADEGDGDGEPASAKRRRVEKGAATDKKSSEVGSREEERLRDQDFDTDSESEPTISPLSTQLFRDNHRMWEYVRELRRCGNDIEDAHCGGSTSLAPFMMTAISASLQCASSLRKQKTQFADRRGFRVLIAVSKVFFEEDTTWILDNDMPDNCIQSLTTKLANEWTHILHGKDRRGRAIWTPEYLGVESWEFLNHMGRFVCEDVRELITVDSLRDGLKYALKKPAVGPNVTAASAASAGSSSSAAPAPSEPPAEPAASSASSSASLQRDRFGRTPVVEIAYLAPVDRTQNAKTKSKGKKCPGPHPSTLTLGTVRRGRDRNWWYVDVDDAGVKRWQIVGLIFGRLNAWGPKKEEIEDIIWRSLRSEGKIRGGNKH